MGWCILGELCRDDKISGWMVCVPFSTMSGSMPPNITVYCCLVISFIFIICIPFIYYSIVKICAKNFPILLAHNTQDAIEYLLFIKPNKLFTCYMLLSLLLQA